MKLKKKFPLEAQKKKEYKKKSQSFCRVLISKGFLQVTKKERQKHKLDQKGKLTREVTYNDGKWF